MNHQNRRINSIYQAIDLIDPVTTFADIGTDHGMIAAEILNRYSLKTMIVSDISFESLEKARQLFSQTENNVQIRQGYGLSILLEDEVDVILIAGMGGRLIKEILEKDIKRVFKKKRPYLLLQTPQNPDILRKYLFHAGYRILFDRIIQEKGHFYHFIGAQFRSIQKKNNEELSYIQQWLGLKGEFHFFEDDQTRQIFAKRQIQQKKKIIKKIQQHTNVQKKTIDRLDQDINYLQTYLSVRNSDEII